MTWPGPTSHGRNLGQTVFSTSRAPRIASVPGSKWPHSGQVRALAVTAAPH